MRRRLRLLFWCLLLAGPAVLKVADFLSGPPPARGAGLRVVTVNVNTKPIDVAHTLAPLRPDVVFMQETAGPCGEAARVLGLLVHEGSDQCLLSRWPLTARSVAWPGPWQPPQLAVATGPMGGPLLLLNARLALPASLASLSGNSFYTGAQRSRQFAALRHLVEAERRAIVCGDLNAFPFELKLGPRFRDSWVRWTYGGTFPVWLPAARIDQCWATDDLTVTGAWTLAVPSDHRAVVVDIAK